MADSIHGVEAAGYDASVQRIVMADCSKYLKEMNDALIKLQHNVRRAASLEHFKDRAVAYRDEVCTAMEELRRPADALELIVDAKEWPFPTYGDLMFNV